MADILASRNHLVLARFARSNLLVAFDYDGTLAPIVQAPDRARMRPTTRRLLRSVAERYPCMVISGRARADLIRRLGDLPVEHVSGNHGLEPCGENERHVQQAREWIAYLTPRLRFSQGVVIEDKVYSISIHYRGARDKRQALRAIDDALQGLRRARRIGGKLVVNVVPGGAPDKGVALERARRLLACETALYVGDDETDENVFAAMGPRRLLSVRVGPIDQGSRARYLLRHQRQVDNLLRRLIDFRPELR